MLQDEKIITFGRAAELLPPVNGKRFHSTSVWRWARKGLRGVRLDCLRIGGRFVTSMEAVERFGKALAALPADPTGGASRRPLVKPKRRSKARHARSVARSHARLVAAGV
jgi:hypothetical protein